MIKKISLRLKTTLLFLVIALVPLFVFFIVFSNQVKNNIRKLVEENSFLLIEEIASEVKKIANSGLVNLKFLADNPIFLEDGNLEDKTNEMKKFHELYNIYEDVTLLDISGNVLTSTTYSFRGDLSFKQWFKKAKNGEASVSPVHATLNPFKLIIVYTVPIIGKDGDVKFIVSGRLNFKQIWDITDRVTIGKTGYVFITDKKGNILAHTNKKKILYKLTQQGLFNNIQKQGKGSLEFFKDKEKKIKQICFFNNVKIFEKEKSFFWKIGIIQLNKEAYVVISKMQRQMVFGLIIGLILIILFANFISKKIVNPIFSLVKGVKDISEGNLDAKVKIKTKDEINELGEAFNKMAVALRLTTVSVEILEKAQKRFVDVAESSMDWIWEIDKEGKYIYSNSVVSKILGYKPEEVIGKYFYDFFVPEKKEELKKTIFKFFDAKTVFKNFINENIKKEKGIVIIETTGVPVFNKNKEFIGYRGVDRDITERKKIELEMLKAKEIAEEANYSKSQFLANISHDLRTPMNAILGFGDLLQKTKLTKIQEEYIKTIMDSSDILLSLVSDILDIAKIESGELKFERSIFNLKNLVGNIIKMIEPAIKKGVSLNCKIDDNVPLVVKSDSKRIGQVLFNLLSNAAKFTDKGQIDVFLSVVVLKKELCLLKIRVKDTGMGILKEKQSFIFDSFYQVEDSNKSTYLGTGLGLAITKNIVEMMGGKIHVKSEMGKGSEFVFTLELDVPKGGKDVEVLMGTKTKDDDVKEEKDLLLKGIKVLVVEDNLINQKLLRTILINFQCEVTIASNGKEAIDFVKDNDYDICFMDIQMPIMGGIEAVKIIRQDLKKDLIIIAITAAAFEEDKEEALLVGMNDYIIKPVRSNEIVKKFVFWLKQKKLIKK